MYHQFRFDSCSENILKYLSFFEVRKRTGINLHSNIVGRWRIVCTCWVNMIFLQKPQAYRTTKCLFFRVMLNIDQEGKLQSNQPSYANFLPLDGKKFTGWSNMILGWLTTRNNQRNPLRQKNTCANGREHMLMILGKLLSFVCYSERSMNMYVKYRT